MDYRDLTVRDVMRRDIVTVGPETRVADAARLMTERHISGLPVLDADGRPIGVITLSDLVDAERRRDAALVRDLMLGFVLGVPPDAPLMRAIRVMVTDEVHRVLVLEDGKLIGILTTMDALRAIAGPPHTP